jgi:uncharacterized protein (DUF362 family)
MKPTVVVDRLAFGADELLSQMWKAADRIGLLDEVRSARAVLIKPNLTFPVVKHGVTTRVEFVAALVGVLKRAQPDAEILIAEGEGGYNSFSMTNAMRSMGFQALANAHAKTRIVNLSESPRRLQVLNTQRGDYPLELPAVFDEVDFCISCPLPKIHAMTTLTLSLKNLWGCVPDVYRLKNHYMLPHLLPLLSRHLKFRYAFLDGMYGLDHNGPMAGDVVELNWFVAANGLPIFDRLVAFMMGHEWTKIDHMRLAGEYGLMPSEEEVDIVGTPGALARRFTLHRSFWTFPALAAFHSKHLTQLFYLSKLADPLHRIMYTVRKRDISTEYNVDQSERPE